MINLQISPAIKDEVIRALSHGASRDDLILSICERTNLSWPEAEAYVNDIEIEYGVEIDTRAAPVLTALGGVIILGGLALLAAVMTGVFLSLQNIFAGFEQDDLVYVAGYWMEGSQMMRISLLFFPIALGMIIGGVIGLYRRIVPK